MQSLRRYALGILTFALPLTAGAQDPARIDQIAQSYVDNKTFMGTVLVARGPQVLFSKAYGSANLEWNVPNTTRTKFRLGSVTKQFTAAAILLLEERRKLSVTDPVKKHFANAPAAWDNLTIAHLLSHTSGIPNFTSFPEYPKTQPFAMSPTQLVALFRDKPLDFQPGQGWNYSNSGFVLLGHLVETISGVSYEKFVRDNIFTPLGMGDSGYDSNSLVIPNRASGYVSGNGQFQNAGFIHMSIPHGAGALYSTTEDLLKWEQGLFGGKLLQPASLKKMITPVRNGYAFGVGVDTVGGHVVVSHGGGIEGFNTFLSYSVDDKLTIVALGNVNGAAPQDIAGKVARLARGETVVLTSDRKEIVLDTSVLKRYVGAYLMAPGVYMVVTAQGSQLSAKLGNQQPLPIFPESRTMFFAKVVDAQIEFTKDDAQGRPTVLTLHQNGRDQPAPRDNVESTRLVAAAEAFAKRLKDQTAAPGGEAALRRMIGELSIGKPNYELMTPAYADNIRRQLTALQGQISAMGPLQSLTFKGVGPGGADIYTVKFEKSAVEWRIWLAPDGRIENTNFRPAP